MICIDFIGRAADYVYLIIMQISTVRTLLIHSLIWSSLTGISHSIYIE